MGMRVVVIGGGIVGLSSAYYLAERGADVTLFEKGSLGMGSTARSAGGIRTQFDTRVNVELSLESKLVWNDFETEFAVDIEYRKTGYLLLAGSEKTAEAFRKNVEMQRSLGAESEYLVPEEATIYCDGILPDRFVGAAYNGDDGFADPNLAVQGYASRAQESGVEIVTGTAVTDVREHRGEVVGVETDSDRVDTDYVVNAAGPYARRIASMIDVDLPIHPRRRQIAVVDPTEPVPEDDPLTIDLDAGSYFRPERNGAALVGGHFADSDPDCDPDYYSESMDVDWAARAVEHAADFTEYFDADTRIKRGWAGLYAVTPDNHPIIDETAPGFVTASGFSGHGFQHAPATGQIVSELVYDGGPRLVDVSDMTADRFERGEVFVERNVV